jgi:hypothetical protein
MKKFLSIAVFLLVLSSVCWAGGKKDKAQQQPKQQTAPGQQPDQQPATQPAQPPAPASPFFTGDGGKGKSIAILAPQTNGLAENQSYLPALVQGEFVSNFSGFSAISVLDRQRLDDQYAELLSGYYDDNAQAGLDLGRLTPTDYIMGGNITRTATGYALQMQVTKSADKMTAASYSGTCTFAELDNLTGIRRASLDLLQKMGVTPTEQARKELTSAAAENQVNAQTALAQGITAQKSGTVVEALSYYIQSSNYDPNLAEAASRMNILSASISSGNIGEDTRNDIAWRRQWVERLQEAETFFASYVKEQPYYLVYDANIKPAGDPNYQNNTVPLGFWMGSVPDVQWATTINGVTQTVRSGLMATGRAATWQLDWPNKSVGTPSPFTNKETSFTVIAEIINEQEKSIGRQTVTIPSGYTFQRDYKFDVYHNLIDIHTGSIIARQGGVRVVFPAVNADLITDRLTIRIVSVDGVAAETAAKQKKINILPLDNYFEAAGIARLTDDKSRFTVRDDGTLIKSPGTSWRAGENFPIPSTADGVLVSSIPKEMF